MKKPFTPHILPVENINWKQFVPLIGKANAEIARYDGILQGIINPAVLLSPLTTNEAVISSKIEGTQATLEEVLAYEANPDPTSIRVQDIQEVLNYRKAMGYAVEWLITKPITLNMLREIHATLMDSVRGEGKARGEFRKIQNWIGKPGSDIGNAIYIPPEPQHLMTFLDNFEKYIHYDELDYLVQLAFIHAQFEIIHPFLDGNGRLGRMLVPLFLYEKKVLSSPMFYISEYLEQNREQYYHNLNFISETGNWEEWIVFFLKALTFQAKTNSQKAKSILELYETKKLKITQITHSQFAINIVDTLFKMPIFNSTDFTIISKIPKASALRYLKILCNEKIITEMSKGKGRRPSIMVFNKLVDIIK